MQALGYIRTGSRIAVLHTLQRARILQRMSVRLRARPLETEDQVTVSSDLDAPCWYIDHTLLAGPSSNHVQ